jgi:hypothetical protein
MRHAFANQLALIIGILILIIAVIFGFVQG